MKNNLQILTRGILLLLFSVVLSTAAQAYVYIVGPSTICTNNTATYTTSYDQCSYQIQWVAYRNGSAIASSYGSYFSFNPGSSTTSITVVMNAYSYGGGSCYNSYDSRNVSVVNGQTPGTPSVITVSHVSGYLFDLSTSSSNASSYQWSVSNATIQGSSTGSTIRVLSTSGCTFNFQARGKNTACGTTYSSWRTGSHTITAAGAPMYVTGQMYIPRGSSNYEYKAMYAPSDPGIYSWSLSDPGGALSIYSTGGSNAYVSHNGGSYPVLQEAYVQAKRSNRCGSSPWVQMLVRYGGPNSFMRVGEPTIIEDDALGIYPNPIKQGGILSMNFQKDNAPKQIVIMDTSGKMVMQLEVEDANLEINTSEFTKGMYLVKSISGDQEEVSITKFVIE
ncbi:T9SS type A sorting domain-containing protein [Fulvivirga ligni]|uniref:T9SS type A sorting domain-containing protein n=1 Tax=Fulvivirga ligni TaxID=2904246 RepID=UPI001F29A7C6|nr:T9SS type A sorting domain-containing protein [Fulvivirga ligni]UII23212.1 T9SS type A sorting domain-containing protein [Fulvivirga ligni]